MADCIEASCTTRVHEYIVNEAFNSRSSPCPCSTMATKHWSWGPFFFLLTTSCFEPTTLTRMRGVLLALIIIQISYLSILLQALQLQTLIGT